MTQSEEIKSIVESFNHTVERASYCIERFKQSNFNDIQDFRRAGDLIGDVVCLINELNDLAYKTSRYNKEAADKMYGITKQLGDVHSQMFSYWNNHPNWWSFAR